MSWTQVYITGLDKSIDPTDDIIEQLLDKGYKLSNDDILCWAGYGTTLVKRNETTGTCRGFAFLAFFSKEGALIAIDRINNNCQACDGEDDANNNNVDGKMVDGDSTISDDPKLPTTLRAELSNPKNGNKSKKKKSNNNYNGGECSNLPDVRLRRQRAPPIRKHPVITSSDGKRTNLGNKTK